MQLQQAGLIPNLNLTVHLSPWLKFCPQPFGVNPEGLAQRISLREIWLARYFFSIAASDRVTVTVETLCNKVAQYPPGAPSLAAQGVPPVQPTEGAWGILSYFITKSVHRDRRSIRSRE